MVVDGATIGLTFCELQRRRWGRRYWDALVVVLERLVVVVVVMVMAVTARHIG
jgi:hypothetical protein